jgi:GNAT superfamily N-acetyltransferase
MFDVISESRESVRQLAAVWGEIVNDRKSGEVKDLPGISIRWADTRFPFFNAITFTDVGAGRALLSSRLKKAAEYMARSKYSGLIWIFEDLLEPAARSELPRLAERTGLSLCLSGYSMAGNFPMPEPTHPDLDFVRVTTDEQVEAYFDINARAYGMPLDDVRDGMKQSTIWKAEAYSYLGLVDGRPVSAAAAIESDGSLFLALVATLPEAQRKGYGEATCRKALYEASRKTGLTRSVLHATMAGAPIYQRIGYQKIGTIGFYGLNGA